METDASRAKALNRTIEACLANAERLLDETCDLEFRPVEATRLYLALIAQEEIAKAFMLVLVREDIVELDGPVRQALHDHRCKQLVGVLMDYIIMHWEEIEELRRMIREDGDLDGRLSHEAESALVLLRYEKIGQLQSQSWFFMEDPDYHPNVRNIADGAKDRHKQRALYVGVGRDGSLSSTPASSGDPKPEIERGRRYLSLVQSMSSSAEGAGGFSRERLDLVLRASREMFAEKLPGAA